MAAPQPVKPVSATPPVSAPLPSTPVYATEPELETITGIPALYKKVIPFITSVFLGVLRAGKTGIGLVFEGTLGYVEWFYETRFRPQWSEIDYNLRVKFGVSAQVMDDLKQTFDKSSWLALPWYIYLYGVSLLSNFYGTMMNIRASSIQDANRENRINLPSPEQVVIALIRKEISEKEATDLLGRQGISPAVQAVITGTLNQYPSPDAVAVALNRGIIEKNEADDLFNKLNITPLARKTIQGLTAQYTSPENIIVAAIKGEISDDEADSMLDRLNVPVETRKTIIGVIKQIAPDEVLINNVYRGKLSRKDFMKELSRRGYDTDQQTYYENIIDRIPPIQDIIRMAVREAFSEDKVKQFRYDEDYPEVFGSWAEKQGFSADWAKKYWRAHWELPSVSMVFEMLHRGLISEDVVKQFLVIADYPAYWRDLLIKISYNPLTRVDVRRMYEVGTFDKVPGSTPEAEVRRAYKDIGYNDRNADLMTQFTIDLYGEERKKLAEGKVIKFYRQGLIDRSETVSLLKNLKYREEYIDFIIMSADFDRESEVIDALIGKLKSLYLIGRYSKSDVLNEISRELSVSIDTVALFKTWDFEKQTIRRLPTSRDVLTWIENGVIKPSTGIDRLVELGYSKTDAENYVKQLTGYSTLEGKV